MKFHRKNPFLKKKNHATRKLCYRCCCVLFSCLRVYRTSFCSITLYLIIINWQIGLETLKCTRTRLHVDSSDPKCALSQQLLSNNRKFIKTVISLSFICAQYLTTKHLTIYLYVLMNIILSKMISSFKKHTCLSMFSCIVVDIGKKKKMNQRNISRNKTHKNEFS